MSATITNNDEVPLTNQEVDVVIRLGEKVLSTRAIELLEDLGLDRTLQVEGIDGNRKLTGKIAGEKIESLAASSILSGTSIQILSPTRGQGVKI